MGVNGIVIISLPLPVKTSSPVLLLTSFFGRSNQEPCWKKWLSFAERTCGRCMPMAPIPVPNDRASTWCKLAYFKVTFLTQDWNWIEAGRSGTSTCKWAPLAQVKMIESPPSEILAPIPVPTGSNSNTYKGVSITRKWTPLGPYRRPMPRVL